MQSSLTFTKRLTIMQPTSNLSQVRTFTIDLRGAPVEVEARIEKATAEILRVTDAEGQALDVSCDDLDTIEAAIFEETETEAYDFTAGRNVRFRVRHNGEHIVAIFNTGGFLLPEHCPQYTETAEAFLLDREYTAAIESDQPRAAALAGYIHPQPQPHSAGHGLRRAA